MGGLLHLVQQGGASLYQMKQPTHQQPVYQLYIIWCGTASAL